MVSFKNLTKRLKNFFNTHKKLAILIILFILSLIFIFLFHCLSMAYTKSQHHFLYYILEIMFPLF